MQGLDGPPFGMQRAIRVFLVPILVDIQPELTAIHALSDFAPWARS